jgi:hypothetical protein
MKPSNAHPSAQNQVVGDRREQPAPSWSESKRQAVEAACRQVAPDADARQAMGFMPMKMKGAAIRWRGL